ncbi:extracellular solute-binding protein [Sinorhizobium sp. BG8]|uniref:ABC transporter substrate-binding protein n=1 Tax=Sinorhizobium sp. BG8 TaxID=2613773 RepID=UPI00193E4126|nr:extracellular solute-binding protein [Sinorhizobium sp. BG8]QRM57674.1 extracellular solute-binding protein [Sinorhizobium sp. BG8]
MTQHFEKSSKFKSSLGVSRRHFMIGAAGLTAIAGFGMKPVLAAGDVAFLGWEGYDLAFKSKDLLDKAGVSMQTTYISAIEDIITKLRGGGIGSIDLTTLIYQYVGFCGQSELLDPIDESLVPNLASMHPRVKELDKFLRVDGKLYGVPFTFSSIPLLYNPDLVEEPKSWLDLLKPEYKGKVVGYPDVMSMIVTWSKVANGLDDPSKMTRAQLDATVDLMVKVKQNSRTIPSSLGEISDMFSRKEIVMGMGWEPMIKWAGDKGVNLKIASPKEGTFAYFDTVNIAKDAPNSELDHALINWGLSAENQKAFSEANIVGIVNQDAMKAVTDQTVAGIYHFEDLDKYFADKFLPGMFPLEAEGEFVTWDDVLAAFESYQRA